MNRFFPLVLVLCVGCSIGPWSPPARDGSTDGVPSRADRVLFDAGPTPDVVGVDVGVDVPVDRGCPPTTMLCNGACTNVLSDMANCGGCDARCAPANATGLCIAGTCRVASCAANYGDCDGNPANGCEADLRTPATCGACGRRCAAMEVCNSGTCMLTCPAGQTVCSGACVTLSADIANCGACGRACNGANGTASCTAGVCGITCSAGYGNCDGTPTNGCETNLRTTSNCGACGMTCNRPSAVTSCATGDCVLMGCTANYGDCDGNPANGCEVYLAGSNTHCGSCTTVCVSDVGTSSNRCIGGMCRPSCATNYDDCDGNLANGCETQLTTSAHCGACGTSCTAPATCGRLGGGSYGCTTACGESGQSCCTTSMPACRTGACSMGLCCATPLINCGGMCVNGLTNASHCGGCGNVCATNPETTGNACVSGLCAPVCAAGFGNCDSNPANGCETPVNTDTRCGSCATSCATGTTCVSSGGSPACLACGASGQPCCAGTNCMGALSCVSGVCR